MKFISSAVMLASGLGFGEGLPRNPDGLTSPGSAERVANELNNIFHDFTTSNPSSSAGVTITWLTDTEEKLNLFCSSVEGGIDSCWQGRGDCRMSAVIHNHLLPLAPGSNSIITFANRHVGVVFDHDLVNSYYGKCSYVADGSSNLRYNNGCGNIALLQDCTCDSSNSPFSNVCPSTGSTCSAQNPEVNVAACDHGSGHASPTNPSCFYKGPAYDIPNMDFPHYTGGQMFNTENQLHTMMTDRLKLEGDGWSCAPQCWNEVIIDERLLLTQLWWDPAIAVKAFVHNSQGSKAHAMAIQAKFLEEWGVAPPLVAVDTNCDVHTCSPFSADSTPSPTPTPPSPTPQPAQCTFLTNIDCAGHDLSDSPAASLQDCCNLCSETHGCSAFTHNKHDGHGAAHCYLKASCDGQVARQGSNSGAVTEPHCASLSNVDCSGNDLENHAANTSQECCDLCKQTSGCNAYTHNKVDGHGGAHCYLKSSCDTQTTRYGSNSGTLDQFQFGLRLLV